MPTYSLRHVDSDVLLRDLRDLVVQDRVTTAQLLAHLGEVKERRLFAPAGHPHMHAYCVNVLGFSEDVASKRLQAAGAARRYPRIFEAIADGRLRLTGVCLLAPHLLPENADDLITEAMGKTKAGIERLLAARFPQADLPEVIHAMPVTSVSTSPSDPGQMEEESTVPVLDFVPPSDPDQMESGASSPQSFAPPLQGSSRLKPLAPERYGLQVTLDEHAHDLLREAQDLLAHTEGGRQIANVLTRALEVLVKQLRQRRFAETERPRRQDGKPKSSRQVPAAVKRAVRARDQGRCTFVNANGERCPATGGLEYDHAKPVATGGEATLENIRLRCRAHNRLAAEQAYGEAFMREKREASRRRSVNGKAAASGKATKWKAAAGAEVTAREPGTSGSSAASACERRDEAHAMAQQAIHEKAYEVIPWLRLRSMPAPGVP